SCLSCPGPTAEHGSSSWEPWETLSSSERVLHGKHEAGLASLDQENLASCTFKTDPPQGHSGPFSSLAKPQLLHILRVTHLEASSPRPACFLNPWCSVDLLYLSS
ncbi:hypothetical protein H1C71_035401, partial [Ictidomys tridecemlineatus]